MADPVAWSRSRLAEGSTWAAISMWFLAFGVYAMTFWGWWRLMILGAAMCATVAAVLKDKASA